MTTAPLLSVKDLYISYNSARQRLFGPSPKSHQAIKGVSFAVAEGETLALVGESGSGKSSIGNAVLGLVPVQSGQVTFEGADITHATLRQRRALASRLQVIFQNPYGSLNPSLQIGQILTEPLRVLGQQSATESRKTISNLLERVGLPSDAQTRFPGNFSGGQRQRIAIARALAVNPRLVVCDEPTSALDVSTQQSVLELLHELQESIGAAYLFITHDLAVVRQFADRVAVLDHGRIVEVGEAKEVCDSPHHPYTKALIEAAPVPNPAIQRLRRQRRLATRNAGTLAYDV